MNQQLMRDELILDEALRFKPYKDTKGKITIGVGRNLDDDGISHDEAMTMLDNDIAAACLALDGMTPWWRAMSDIRQRVIVNMCFNMGPAKLAEFRLALAAMERGDYNEAANQMQNSEWYNEVHGRAIRLTSLMRNNA